MSPKCLKRNLFYITLIFCFCETISELRSRSPHYKLPSAIFPTKYNLHISTFIHQDITAYNGSVSIDLTIREPTNEIILNSLELRPFKLSLLNLKSGLLLESKQLEYKLDESKEQLRIYWPTFPLKLQIGQEYRLKLDFVGDIKEKPMFGFYKTTYLDEFNNLVPIATTHFEPTSARLAFPCFDEPAFKAKFVISITHGSNYSAISNMPADGDLVLSWTPKGEMVTTKFQQTPKMSTYLIAFALTNYKNTSVVVNGVEHRFFYPPNSKNNGSRVLENSIKTVDAFEKLLGIKYTLPKLDHIEVENLFGFAMENWGLMTFKINQNLSKQENYNNNKIKLLGVISLQNHEIAHQWFGNLVTPVSFSCNWLKEGFSTYFSYVAGHMVYPKEEFLENFLMNIVGPLYTSPLKRSLTSVIEEGANILDNVDIITYFFGASFVRMFHHAIGHSTFMKGIFNYLCIFRYSVADENDFFRTMQAAVDEDKVHLFQNNQSVANVMQTWTHNVGIPTVQVIRNYDNGTITIRQKSNSENKDQKWWIPMNFATAANPDFERTVADYIMPPQDEVTLDLKELNISLSNSDWLIVNKQQSAMFYVVYDDLNLKLIAEALIKNHKQIHVFNRALIFRDLSGTFEEDLDAVEPILGILQYLKLEEESLPWFNAFDLIMKFLSRLEDSKASKKFQDFIYDIIVEINDKKYQEPLKIFTSTDLEAKAKITELKFNVDSTTCQNYTTQTTKEYLLNGVSETKRPCMQIICQAFQNATFFEFRPFFEKCGDEKTTPGYYECLNALKCIESNDLFQAFYIALIRNENNLQMFNSIDNLFIFNKFFETWFLNHTYTGELHWIFSLGHKTDKYLRGKIMIRKTFLRKYENSISTWLENYEKKREK